MSQKLNMDQVRISLVYRMKDLNELPRLRMYLIMTKNPKDQDQINEVYQQALLLTAKTDEQVKEMMDRAKNDTGSILQRELQQVKVYTMCGGGFLGDFAATLPESFYIDPRAGRTPYAQSEIEQQVGILKDMFRDTIRGSIDLPAFHKCGIN